MSKMQLRAEYDAQYAKYVEAWASGNWKLASSFADAQCKIGDKIAKLSK